MNRLVMFQLSRSTCFGLRAFQSLGRPPFICSPFISLCSSTASLTNNGSNCRGLLYTLGQLLLTAIPRYWSTLAAVLCCVHAYTNNVSHVHIHMWDLLICVLILFQRERSRAQATSCSCISRSIHLQACLTLDYYLQPTLSHGARGTTAAFSVHYSDQPGVFGRFTHYTMEYYGMR